MFFCCFFNNDKRNISKFIIKYLLEAWGLQFVGGGKVTEKQLDFKQHLLSNKCFITLLGFVKSCFKQIVKTHHEDPREPKVSNFANVVLSHQNISGCQVSVDVILCLQESHAWSHLGGHLDLVRYT